jgi:superfamily I DNA/RNA helicase
LHPTQRKIINRDWNGPVRVIGGAGTGKTVVALHRAKWLAENRLQGKEDKILFTTFTRNLAVDIQQNLSKICTPNILQRIEVINLDRWVSNYLRKFGYKYEIDYGNRINALWENALTLIPSMLELSEEFFKEEWEKIIQPHGISTEMDYLKISRVGRGTKLSRKQRKQIWPVFEEYRLQLNENGLKEPEDAMRDVRIILEQKDKTLPYRSIIVDEAQDMGSQAFMLLRQLITKEDKNDLFIVGDGHQRIYRHKIVLGQCGINILGRSRKLRINYRTTEETRRWAMQLLEGMNIDDLDGGLDDQKGYKSLMHGVSPQVQKFDSISKELEYIVNYLKRVKKEEGTLTGVCLVARTNALVTQYQDLLNNNDIETYVIRRSESEDRSKIGVRLATMHRVKGLEFERVIVVNVNDGIVPYIGKKQSSDPVIKREIELQERALLYVSVTRARKEVVITSNALPSKFLT